MYGGVSQQPAALRLDNQCEEMTNCIPTLVDGVYKPPPTEFVSQLREHTPSATTLRPHKIHFIDRDSQEKYAVIFTGDATTPIEIYSLLDGSLKTLSYNDAVPDKAYLTAANARSIIKALTVADTTIVANNTKTPAKSGVPDQGWLFPTAIVNVTHGVAGTTYSIYIDNIQVATFTTGTTTDYATFRTSNIATELYNDLVTWQLTHTTFRVAKEDNVILIYNPSNVDFDFRVTDSWGNAGMVGIKGEVEKIDDLPKHLPAIVADAAGGEQGIVKSVLTVRPIEPISDTGTPQTYTITINGHSVEMVLDGPNYEWVTYSLSQLKIALEAMFVTYSMSGFVVEGPVEIDDPHHWYRRYVNGWADFITIWNTEDTFTITCSVDTASLGSTYILTNTTGGVGDGAGTTLGEVVVYVGKDRDKPESFGYYLKWVAETEEGTKNTGVWKETTKQNQDNHYNADTLPHRLIRNADGTFTFGTIDWDARKVGDDDSIPYPSFIGNPIMDVFFHKNRVGFLAAGNVILSKADKYWDFFGTTALEVLDDDPVDITVPTTGVDALRWGVPNKGDLLVFGPTDEYMLTSGDQVFGARTAVMDTNTNFPISALAAPIRCGANVFFVSPKGEYASFHEYFTQPQTLTDDAADVAAHCPRYLPADVAYVTGSPTFNMMLACTGDDLEVFGYKYYWAGDQKAQSA